MSQEFNTELDPYADREARKYKNPIPSREYIIKHINKTQRALSVHALQKAFKLRDSGRKEALRRRLLAMVRDQQLHKNSYGKFQIKHPLNTSHRFHTLKSSIGQVIVEKDIAYFQPCLPKQAHRVEINQWKNDAQQGDYVAVVQQGPHIKITQNFGRADHPSTVNQVALALHQISNTRPDTVESELSTLPAFVGKDLYSIPRQDKCELNFITIDNKNAQDLDDAVYCEALPEGGWLLYVAIADVSHYVPAETALDQSAYERATSVYLPNDVVHMLPEALSNDICSLNPHRTRLTMICEMHIHPEGKVKNYTFYPAKIISQSRLSYVEADQLLAEAIDSSSPSWLHKLLLDLHSLYHILYQQRLTRGALQFNNAEIDINFNEEGSIESLTPYPRTLFSQVIEACMLQANTSAAQYLCRYKMPALFRVHQGPDKATWPELKKLLKTMKIKSCPGGYPSPKKYSKLLENIKSNEKYTFLEMLLLRSLSKAYYTPHVAPHFGLALSQYCHFTSPIRRYPDLIVHRAIKHILTEQPRENFVHSLNSLETYAEHCSRMEQNAERTSYYAEEWLKHLFMQKHRGERFKGVITGVTHFGLFVQLTSVKITGLVHIVNLTDDFYRFDTTQHRLIGQNSGKIYQLGHSVDVTVRAVNPNQQTIDLKLNS